MDQFKELKPGDKISVPGLPLTFIVVGYIPGGYNRLILRAESANGSQILKIASAHAIDENDIQFHDFCPLVLQYHARLKSLGVKTPGGISTHTFEIDGKHFFLEISPFSGDCVHDLLLNTNSEEETVNLVKGMIKVALQPIFGQALNEDGCFPVGIDMIPRNFTLDSREELAISYVDLWPPKLMHTQTSANRYSLEYPEPTDPEVIRVGIYRHYTPLGILHAFLIQLCRLSPKQRGLFRELVTGFLTEMNFKVVRSRFENLPAVRFENGANLSELLEPLGFTEIYDIRDIACVLAFLNKLTQVELEEIFSLTHFQDQRLSDETIRLIKEKLLAV